MTPTGIVLIVGFVVIFIVCLFIDKNSSKKFIKEIEEKYPPKDGFGNVWVTEKGELIYYLPSGTLCGYKKWNLQEIGYIATYKGQFSLQDRNQQTMKGEYLTPSKKKYLKEKAYCAFNVGYSTADKYVEFVKKHGTHIQHIANGQIQE